MNQLYDFITPSKLFLESIYQDRGSYLTSFSSYLEYGTAFAKDNTLTIGVTVLAIGMGYAAYKHYFKKQVNKDLPTYLENRPSDYDKLSDAQKLIFNFSVLANIFSKRENEVLLNYFYSETKAEKAIKTVTSAFNKSIEEAF